MTIFVPKTKQFSHQEKELAEHGHDPFRAIWWEPGTGKSKQHIDNASLLYREKAIDGSLLVAPNGLHRNFVRREIPKHLPDDIAEESAIFYWKTEKANTKYHQREARDFLDAKRPFKQLAMSYDGLMTDKGRALAKEFLVSLGKQRVLYGLDESQRIKNPDAARTERVLASGDFAYWKRIYTGTPVAAAPWDVQTQIKFLNKDFWIPHGLNSPEAMKSTFGVWDRTGRKINIAQMRGMLTEAALANADDKQKANHRRSLAWYEENGVPPELRTFYQPIDGGQAMMLIPALAKQENGRPRYKNLSKLRDMLAAIRSRVLKKDVFDLPGKLYTTLEFDLSPAQQKAYDSMQQLGFYMLNDRQCTADMALTLMLRLQQIACGYLVTDLEHGEEDPVVLPIKPNPRMDLLMEIVKDLPHQFLIWARFTSDIDTIIEALAKEGIKVAPYYGKITDEECGDNEDRFHAGDVQGLVLNQAKGSEGLTLVEAKTAIYYSNTYKLIERLQSEDRPDRYGQDTKVNNIDLVARNTVDEGIVENLLGKFDVASMVTGDTMRSWLKGSKTLI